jgi:hypothetical protein
VVRQQSLVSVIWYFLFKPDDIGNAALVMFFASRHVVETGDSGLRDYFEGQLLHLAELVAIDCEKKGIRLAEDENYRRIGELLLDAARNISKKTENPSETIQAYSDVTVSIVRRWPELAAVIRHSLPALLRALPIKGQGRLWVLTFTLRGLC